jgi:hypothetical protein
VALFERYRESLIDVLAGCSSGRELAERGHVNDKMLAGALDASQCAPRFDGSPQWLTDQRMQLAGRCQLAEDYVFAGAGAPAALRARSSSAIR